METNISNNLRRYLQNPKSPEAHAFFEGARSMMTALQLAPSSEYPSMLSTSNQQHIIALLVQSDEQQRARRRKDVQQMLKLYSVDKLSFLAFVFDLPKINIYGQAIDENDDPLEDEMFRPLPGKTHDGWPDRKIEHYHTDQEITRAEYLALGSMDQHDYSYQRYFSLHLRDSNKPSFRICSTDRYLMEELIRQSILIGDPDINRRYLTEIYFSAEDETEGLLYNYRQTIINAFDEMRIANHVGKVGAIITSQASNGYIRSTGQLLIAQFQWLLAIAKPDDLLKASPKDISTWAQAIEACKTNNDTALAKFITDDDIAGYQNVNGNPLPGAIQRTTDSKITWELTNYYEGMPLCMQKAFLKHILVNLRLCKHLTGMLNRALDSDDLETINANPGIIMALRELLATLYQYG